MTESTWIAYCLKHDRRAGYFLPDRESFYRPADTCDCPDQAFVICHVSYEIFLSQKQKMSFEAGGAHAWSDITSQKESRKAQCVEKCQHPADFVCDYEDGTLHCLECIAEKFWQIEDILSGKHNVHTYWGALEAIAHPERYITKYDPVDLARKALGEK